MQAVRPVLQEGFPTAGNWLSRWGFPRPGDWRWFPELTATGVWGKSTWDKRLNLKLAAPRTAS